MLKFSITIQSSCLLICCIAHNDLNRQVVFHCVVGSWTVEWPEATVFLFDDRVMFTTGGTEVMLKTLWKHDTDGCCSMCCHILAGWSLQYKLVLILCFFSETHLNHFQRIFLNLNKIIMDIWLEVYCFIITDANWLLLHIYFLWPIFKAPYWTHIHMHTLYESRCLTKMQFSRELCREGALKYRCASVSLKDKDRNPEKKRRLD